MPCPLWFVILGAAAAFARGQAAPDFPEPDDLPTGVVVDEEQQPIRGARVRIMAADPHWEGFGHVIAHVLARTPLPETWTGRDGSFVLPFTESHRALRLMTVRRSLDKDAYFWLVVEHDGYHPWREPLTEGLENYLGSRVVLRRVRADDPFANLPWPPVGDRLDRAWISIDEAPRDPVLARRGVFDVRPRDKRPQQVRIVVTDDSGTPFADATVLLSDRCAVGEADGLETVTDAAGVVEVKAFPGFGQAVVYADGYLPTPVGWEVMPGQPTKDVECVLLPCVRQNVLAVDSDGFAVPFVRLRFEPSMRRSGFPVFGVMTDSLGRARVLLPAGVSYSVRDRHKAAVKHSEGGVLRVHVARPVTLVLHVDAMPGKGSILLASMGDVRQLEFRGAPMGARRIATRACARGYDWMSIVGGSRTPLLVEPRDLPPQPEEPLLDFAVLDRQRRLRAELLVAWPGTSGAPMFALRTVDENGKTRLRNDVELEVPTTRDGVYRVWARHDRALDFFVGASRHEATRVLVPALDAKVGPLHLTVQLERKL